MTKGKKAINVNIVSNDVNMLWKETFKSDASLDFSDPQTIQKIVDFTNNLTERDWQKEKDQVITENILNLSIGPQFQEAITNLKEKRKNEKKSKASLDKQVETRRQKKQRMEE
jgi:hypothetical protein